MEGFCRSCLVKYDELTDLMTYTEKNRRLFVYATGLQVKRNDAFTFQLCKECYLNMKVACNFKKTCRNSDKKLKNYLANKEVGDNVDFHTFIKNNDDSFKFRLPMHTGNSTPANRNKEDDNESTCTSIQNFMTEILRPDEILDSEARIIKEVIEEEADILEDSLDSHWLQDDVSIDTDFRLDFSFSPFSTPRSTNNYNSPKKLHPTTDQKENIPPVKFELEKDTDAIDNFNAPIEYEKVEDDNALKNEKCTIDINLANALKNDSAQKVMLDELLATPPVLPNIAAPSTPMIANILFGDQIDMDGETKSKNVYMPTSDIKDVFYDFFEQNNEKNENIKHDDLMDLVLDSGNYKMNDINGVNENEIIDIKEPTSPIENKYCLEKFYCKICERQFKSLVALKVHCMKRHKIKIEKPKTKRIRKHMICDYCGKLFTSSRCIVKHIQNHMKPYQYDCDHCPLSFRTEVGVKNHMVTHGISYKPSEKNKKRTLKKYVCNVCGSVQTNSSNYHTHMRRHTNKYSKSCSVCGKGFYRTYDLDAHMRRHTGERPFECMYCPSTFSRQDSLNRHIKCHTGEKPFSCTFCDSKFISNKDLANHQMKNKTCLEKQMMIVGDTDMTSLDDIVVHYDKFSSNDTEDIIKKLISKTD